MENAKIGSYVQPTQVKTENHRTVPAPENSTQLNGLKSLPDAEKQKTNTESLEQQKSLSEQLTDQQKEIQAKYIPAVEVDSKDQHPITLTQEKPAPKTVPSDSSVSAMEAEFKSALARDESEAVHRLTATLNYLKEAV